MSEQDDLAFMQALADGGATMEEISALMAMRMREQVPSQPQAAPTQPARPSTGRRSGRSARTPSGESPLSNLFGTFVSDVTGMVPGLIEGVVQGTKRALEGDEQGRLPDPTTTGILRNIAGRLIVDPMEEQALKAVDAYQQGDTGRALLHGAGSVVPGYGPAVADAMSQVFNPDRDMMETSEGLGHLASALAMPKIIRGSARVPAAAGRRLQTRMVKRSATRQEAPGRYVRGTVAYQNQSNPREYQNLYAGQREIASARLRAGANAVNEPSVHRANATLEAANTNVGVQTRNSTMPASQLQTALDRMDDAIAKMESSSGGMNTPSRIAQAVKRRNQFARDWSLEETTLRTRRDPSRGETVVQRDTADRVQAGRDADMTATMGRGTMNQATARGTLRPGETFEQVYPGRDPVSQDVLNSLGAVPDSVRMGGRAGEMSPIEVVSETSSRIQDMPGASVQAGKRTSAARRNFTKAPGAPNPPLTPAREMEVIAENAFREWQHTQPEINRALRDAQTANAMQQTVASAKAPKPPSYMEMADIRKPLVGLEKGLEAFYRTRRPFGLGVPYGGTTQALYNLGGAEIRMGQALESLANRVPNQAAILAQLLSQTAE